MSIAGKTQSQPYTPQPASTAHGSERDYSGSIAVASGVLGAAVALVGVALWSIPLVVASAILLSGWAFLTAANRNK